MAVPSASQENLHELLNVQMGARYRPTDPSDFTGLDSLKLMTAEQYADGCPDGTGAYIQECAASLFHELDTRTNVRRYLNGNQRLRLVGRNPQSEGLHDTVDHIFDQVAFTVEQARSLEQLAMDEIGDERKQVLSDDETSYKVLKLLGARLSDENEMFTGDETKLRVGLWTVLEMADPRFLLALEDRIGKRALNGNPYAKYYARDMLQEAIKPSEAEVMSAESVQLRDHLSVVKAMNGIGDEEAIEQMLRPEVLSNWPPNLKDNIENGINNLIVEYGRNSGPRRRYLTRYMLAFSHPDAKSFGKATDRLAKNLRKLEESPTKQSNTKADQVAARVEARRLKTAKGVGEAVVNITQETQPPTEKKAEVAVQPHIGPTPGMLNRITRSRVDLPSDLSTSAILAALARLGIDEVPGAGKGSHRKVYSPEVGKTTTVSENLGPRALKKLLGQLGVTPQQFIDKL
jgi:predicted RNA binding protein YcfA (HicA-like mRNA interferase family)